MRGLPGRRRIDHQRKVVMRARSHIIRNVVLTLGIVVGLTVAAAIIENGALAITVALVALAAITLVLPLVVIHYDEHDERLGGRRLGSRH